MIIAIDPSIRSVGMAKVDDAGTVTSIGGIIMNEKASKEDYPERALRMVESVVRMVYSWDDMATPVAVVCETPAHWNHSRGLDSEASESVQKLYWFVGALCAALQLSTIVHSLHVVRPNEWKGTTPKPIMVRRSTAALSSLFTPDEIEGLTHDTHEAVCLARWFHGKIHAGAYQGQGLKHRPDLNMSIFSCDSSGPYVD